MQSIIKNDNEAYQEQRLAQIELEYIKFKDTLSELSQDYLFQEIKTSWGMGYNLSPAEKLIDDANNGRKIKSIEEYGAKRIVLPTRKKILRYIPSNENFTCNENCDPVEIIETYFSDDRSVSDNLLSNAGIDHCIKDRKHSSISRRILLELSKNNGKRRAIFAILKGHNILPDVVNEQSSIFIFDAVKDKYFLRDLLDYDIQLSNIQDYKSNPLLARWTVKTSDDVASLILLKEHGIDFKDPQLIDIALEKGISKSDKLACQTIYTVLNQKNFKTRSLTFFSFLLDQQINISTQDIENRIGFFKDHKKNYDYKAFKALLYARVTKDFCPYRNIILNKLEQDRNNKLEQDAYKESYQKLIEPLKSIESYQGRSIEEVQKTVNALEISIANILKKLSTADLIKYSDFFCGLKKNITKINYSREEKIRKMIHEALQTTPWWLLGVSLSAYCMYQLNVNAISGAGAVLSGWKLYSQLKEQYRSYHNMITVISLQNHMSYLEGYLCGRMGWNTNNEGIELAYEQQYEKNVKKWHWEKDFFLIPGVMTTTFFCFSKLLLNEDFNIQITDVVKLFLGILFSNLLFLRGEESVKATWDSLPKLLKCYEKRGRQAGYANRNGNGEQPQFIKQIEIDQSSLESSTSGIFQQVKTIFGCLSSVANRVKTDIIIFPKIYWDLCLV